MFDYSEYIKTEDSLGKVEEKVIKRHFDKMIEGNDCFNDMSGPEYSHFYFIFKHGWILSQMFIK